MYEGYLPISKQDMQERGIKQLDFVYVCGDAYVDHPSFGHAIIARLLEAHGYTVGIIAQPDWKDDASISVLGVPRSWLFGFCRKYGFYGESLFGIQKTPCNRFLYPGRRNGKATGLCYRGVL